MNHRTTSLLIELHGHARRSALWPVSARASGGVGDPRRARLTARRRHARGWLAVFCVLGASFAASGLSAENSAENDARLRTIFSGSAPESVDDLRAMQRHVQSLSERVLPACVGVQVGAAQGSGVMISAQGHVLTAAHVIGKSGRDAMVYLSDGPPVIAKTLGTFRTMDAGLLKIQTLPNNPQKEWPHVDMGDSASVTLGQWCLATGHPGGIQNARQPSVRFGRILSINPTNALSSDCTLIGGDSGGPLFDMQGKVIGVHSRIGGPLTANLHVPVNAYREYWSRLDRGDNWGFTPGNRPFIGVQGVADTGPCKLARVFPRSPAEQAGVQVNDVFLSIAGQQVSDFASLRSYVEDLEPGAKIPIEVQRGEQRLKLEIVIGRVRE